MGIGGEKLKYAIDRLGVCLVGQVGADFGCNIGGFTDCMLHEGVVRVYAVDTGYGMLEWKLRQDDRVVVMERTNAMHVELPEKVDVVTVDAGWTRQRHILPNALAQAKAEGRILSLFKPQYEAPPEAVRRGRIIDERFDDVLESTVGELSDMGIHVRDIVRLPHDRPRKNPEAMLHIVPTDCPDAPEPG